MLYNDIQHLEACFRETNIYLDMTYKSSIHPPHLLSLPVPLSPPVMCTSSTLAVSLTSAEWYHHRPLGSALHQCDWGEMLLIGGGRSIPGEWMSHRKLSNCLTPWGKCKLTFQITTLYCSLSLAIMLNTIKLKNFCLKKVCPTHGHLPLHYRNNYVMYRFYVCIGTRQKIRGI